MAEPRILSVQEAVLLARIKGALTTYQFATRDEKARAILEVVLDSDPIRENARPDE